jgi:hypothetical protein
MPTPVVRPEPARHALFQVLVHSLGHLEHVELLGFKDRLQCIVRDDFALILWILQIMFLDVRPDLLCDFSPG